MGYPDSDKEQTHLVLGWHVTNTREPKYWVGRKPKLGSQTNEHLLRISADSLGAHTAIIAQSGSGKSFFLGRLIEEIVLQTKARCVILDPNADFRRIHEVENSTLWENASYDSHKRQGKLPHETSQKEFSDKWSRVKIRIKMGNSMSNIPPYEPLKLWWPSLSMDFLAEDIEPMLRSDLYHCHAFVQAIGTLLQFRKSRMIGTEVSKPPNLIDEAERLLRLARQLSEEDFLSILLNEFETMKPMDNYIERIISACGYVSDGIARFYFGKAREYEAAGILQKSQELSSLSPDNNRLTVIDLPSLADKRTRLLAINALLTTEWDNARNNWATALQQPPNQDTRIPTFVVIDEAHNLIPSDPRTKAEMALREQFRTIVAEGRKYGLFLILVSQRPDKLDPIVLSECENKAVMKLGSKSVLKITEEMLGLDDIPKNMLDKCLEFETGRGLLIGRWSQENPQIFYCAARRTVEGGRNLREAHWASPDFLSQESPIAGSQPLVTTNHNKKSPTKTVKSQVIQPKELKEALISTTQKFNVTCREVTLFKVLIYISTHNKIGAIKRFREDVPFGLKEAKDFVEEIMRVFPQLWGLPDPLDQTLEQVFTHIIKALNLDPKKSVLAELTNAISTENKTQIIDILQNKAAASPMEAEEFVKVVIKEVSLGNSFNTPRSQLFNHIIQKFNIKCEELTLSSVVNSLSKGNKIEAIKIFRDETNVSLSQAKDFVEEVIKDFPYLYLKPV